MTRKKSIKSNANKLVHASMTGGIILPLVFAFFAMLFGLIGWSIAIYDGSFRSIIEIFTRVVGSFIPSSQGSSGGNWATQSGTLFANVTTISGGIIIALTTAREFLTRWRARLFWKSHAVVIGDTPLARQVAEGFDSDGERVLHAVPIDAPKVLPAGPARVRSGNGAADIGKFGLKSARTIVIDLGGDAVNLSLTRAVLAELARDARKSLQGASGKAPTIAVNVVDPVLSDRFSNHLLTAASVHRDGQATRVGRPAFFDTNKVIARDTLARHPLFQLAKEREQSRVHALIIGFGRLGEHLLDQVMLTGLAGDLLPPRVTIVDRAGTQREREFRARRPSVADSLDIQFVEFDFECHSVDQSTPSQALLARLAHDALTAIFVVLPSDEDVLRTTLLIDNVRSAYPVFDATVFYRSRLAEGQHDVLGDLMAVPVAPGKFLRMRLPLRKLLKEISDPDGRDKLAQALHRSYLANSDVSAQGGLVWEKLPESLRRANVRAADHLPAKLWSLGLDPHLAYGGGEPRDLEKVNDIVDRLKRDPLSFHRLAELEHGRWAIERKLDGWTWAERRDDAKRHHPSLVDWSELKSSEQEVEKDVRQFATSLQFVLDSLRKNAV